MSKKNLLRAGALATIVAAGAVTAVAPASAGTNGQLVQVCSTDLRFQEVSIWGTDYKGDFDQVESGTLRVGDRMCTSNGLFKTWFKGDIGIRYKFKGAKKSYQQSRYIPPVVAGTDLWTVFVYTP
jgi:hypothetical protein